MKKLTYLLFVLISLCAVGAGSAYFYSKRSLPVRSGLTNIPDLKSPVKVGYDEFGVPHIQAASMEDSFVALGFVHAQDRLLQMEGLRHISQGRLAELVGPDALRSDIFFRELDIHGKAQELVAQLDHDSRVFRSMNSYVKGVNAYIHTGVIPLDYRMLVGHAEDFSLVDMVSIAAYTIFTFDRGLKTDSLLFQLQQELSRKLLADLDTGFEHSYYASLMNMSPFLNHLEQLDKFKADYGSFMGSNAWVVDGAHSESGFPILANDTHIKFSNPSVWYEAYLSSPEYEIYGHFLPMVSIPLLGHSQSHGWGVTIFHNNDIDIYPEEDNPLKKGQILRDGQPYALKERDEVIHIKGSEDHKMTVSKSDVGPVVSLSNGRKASVRWNFLEADSSCLKGLFGLSESKDLSTAEKNISLISTPSLNILYANKAGDIAHWLTGSIASLSSYPHHVSAASLAHTKYRPTSENPSIVNPSKGYIFSTNHRLEKAPGYYSYPARAKRLEFLLGEKHKFSVADFKAMQNDTTISFHRPLVMLLKRVLSSQEQLDVPVSSEAFEALDRWEGQHEIDQSGATIFHSFLYQLLRNTFEDEMTEESYKSFSKSYLALRSLMSLLPKTGSEWWDLKSTSYQEKREDIILLSWRDALQHLVRLYGYDVAEWHWGRYHQVSFNHPLGRIPLLAPIFNVGPYPASGSIETLNQMGFYFGAGPVTSDRGPATRKIVDFAHPSRFHSIIPTGQSGHALDRHYSDQTELFIHGKYRNVHFKPESYKSELRLEP